MPPPTPFEVGAKCQLTLPSQDAQYLLAFQLVGSLPSHTQGCLTGTAGEAHRGEGRERGGGRCQMWKEGVEGRHLRLIQLDWILLHGFCCMFFILFGRLKFWITVIW